MDPETVGFLEEGIIDEIIVNNVAIDEEMVLSTSMSPPTSLTLQRTVSVSCHCDSVFHYNGETYIGLFNRDVDKIDHNYHLIPSFIAQNGSIFSICIHEDRIYSLLFGSPYIINVHDLHSRELIATWNHLDDAYSHNKLCVVSNKVVIPDRRSKSLSLYRLSGEPLKNIYCPQLGTGYVSICCASPDSVIVSDSVCSRLFRVDLQTGKEIWSCNTLGVIPHAVTCDEHRYVYVTGYRSPTIWILDLNTGDVVSEIDEAIMHDLGAVFDLCVYGDMLIIPDCDNKRVLFYQLKW